MDGRRSWSAGIRAGADAVDPQRQQRRGRIVARSRQNRADQRAGIIATLPMSGSLTEIGQPASKP
jgi:hypothetical protein